MAKCVKIKVVPPPPPHPLPMEYVLTLSQQEAETLMIITGWVGGPYSGRRRDMESIQQALRSAGMDEQFEHPDYENGSINFKDGITHRPKEVK